MLFYLSHGLVLEKVHRIVSFNQKPFLKDYILTLTRLRSKAGEQNLTFSVSIFKLLENIPMENLRKILIILHMQNFV